MRINRLQIIGLGTLFAATVLVGACKRQVAAVTPPPPPPPPPAAPAVVLSAEPSSIQQGESATLRWSSQNATELNLEPGGDQVEAEGSRSVSPSESTTYTLTARGPGGSAEATARLTVTIPSPTTTTPAATPAPDLGLDELFDRGIRHALFDFDKADIRSDAREALSISANFLRANPQVRISIEGHCDERGSTAYNLGLGDRRANAARDFLVSLGIAADRVSTISYGKERPFCTARDESCWQQNRQAHLVCSNCELAERR